MFKVIKYLLVLSLVICIASCSSKKNEIAINFSTDSSSIIINNIDEASFLQVKKLYNASADTVNFLAVLKIPDTNDSLQMEEKVDGVLKLSKNEIIFTPKTPFLKGKSYLIESYINSNFISVDKIFKNEVKTNLQPQQQILTR